VLHRDLPGRFLDTGPGALTLIAADGPAVLRGPSVSFCGVRVAITPVCSDATNWRPGPDQRAISPPAWERPIPSL